MGAFTQRFYLDNKSEINAPGKNPGVDLDNSQRREYWRSVEIKHIIIDRTWGEWYYGQFS